MQRQIRSATVELYRVPLPEVVFDAAHGSHTHFELVIVKLKQQDGLEGVGYTYTGGKGGASIVALCEELRSVLVGQDAARIEKLWADMTSHVHYVARGGIASFAISAMDIALWDLRCKRNQEPLWVAVGGHGQRCKCYRGGIDLAYSTEELVASVQGYLREGHSAVKIKVGHPGGLSEDLCRLRAVREALGPERQLMADANMGWGSAVAARAGASLAELDVVFLEEPLKPDDWEGYRLLRGKCPVPLAQGENLHTIEEFRHAFTKQCIDYPEPDASNIGGVTGFLKVAKLAEAFGLPTCSHGMQELHVSLVSGIPNGGFVEIHSFPIDQYTIRGKVQVKEGWAQAPDSCDIGVQFDWAKLQPHRLQSSDFELQ